MSLQLLEVKWKVDSSELELSKKLLADVAKQSGLAEDDVEKLNAQYSNQAKAVADVTAEQKKQTAGLKSLTTEAKKLEKAIDKTASQDEFEKLNKELKETKDKLKLARLEADKLDRELDKAGGNKLSGLKSSLGSIADIATGGLIAGGITSLVQGVISGFSQIASESIELYDIQATADEQLRAGLESTNNLVNRTVEQLKAQASELQGVSLFGDEQIEGAQSVLLTFTNIREEIFDRTIPAILDMSAKLGTDLNSSALQVGKALNDPLAGISALGRAGVQFSEDQEQLIKSLTKTGDIAGAQAIILAELETQFKGSALAAAQAGAGGITQLENKISDVKEEIGEKLIPVMESAAEFQLKFINAVLATVSAFTEFFGISSKVSDKTIEQQSNFNTLITALNNTNESINEVGISESQLTTRQEQRKIIIDQINANYGEYLPNLLDEKSSIDDITKAQAAGNEVFREKIRLLAQQEKLQEIEKEAVKTQKDLLDIETEIARIRNRGVADVQAGFGVVAGSGLSAADQIRDLEMLATGLETKLEDLRGQSASIIPINIDTSSDGQKDGLDTATKKVQTLGGEIERLKAEIESQKSQRLNLEIGVDPSAIDKNIAELQGQLAKLQGKEKAVKVKVKPEIEKITSEDVQKALSNVTGDLSGEIDGLELKIDADAESLEIENKKNGAINFRLEQQQKELELELQIIREKANSLALDEKANEQLQQTLTALDTFKGFLGNLSFDTSGFDDIASILQENGLGQLTNEDQLQIASAGISQLGSILDEFSDTRVKKKEVEKAALIKLEKETGVSQEQAIAETDAEITQIRRNQFIRNKAQAAAEAAINTALAVTQVISQAPLAAPVLVPIVLGLGAVQLGLILAQPVPFRDGVFSLGDKSERSIPGIGTGTSDSIPARLSRGESVITAKDTLAYSEHIRGITEKRKASRFKFGNTELLGFDMPESDRKTLESIMKSHKSNRITEENNLTQSKLVRIQPEDIILKREITVNAGRTQKINYEDLAKALAKEFVSTENKALWKDGHLMKAMYNEMIASNAKQTKLLTEIVNNNASNR